MSFFSSLQQYVTSGVAGLGLNPRRFSLSRQESTEATTPAASPSPMMSSGGSSIGSYGAMGGSGGVGMGSGATGGPASLGYPKVVTPSGPGGSIVGPSSGSSVGSGGTVTSGVGTGSSTNLTVTGAAGSTSAGGGSGGAGAAGNVSPMRRQSSARGLDTLVPPGRTGSFRGRNSPNPTSPDKPCFSVWKRRPSWPEVEIKSSSG
nr:loricrin-like [Aedes albopictus]